MMDRIRRIISDRIKDKGLTLKDVSLGLGRSHSYMQQFIERGVPSKLNETVRHNLAEMLDLPEADIGGIVRVTDMPNAVSGDIASLDIHAGMGNGGMQSVMRADGETRIAPEYLKGHWSFPDPVKAMWQGMENTYAFPVTGDSMSPTLESGCYVFVDTNHLHPAPADIYVVDYGDGLMVKRIELVPQSDKVKVISDNDRYSDYDLHRQDLFVFGRVVAWFQWRG